MYLRNGCCSRNMLLCKMIPHKLCMGRYSGPGVPKHKRQSLQSCKRPMSHFLSHDIDEIAALSPK